MGYRKLNFEFLFLNEILRNDLILNITTAIDVGNISFIMKAWIFFEILGYM